MSIPSDSIPSGSVDVVIVGGGIAGLMAARMLSAARLSLVVLEARGRVGGRLLTRNALDLGATWFWPGEPRIHQLIDELDLATHAQHLAGDAMYHTAEGAQRIEGNPIDVASRRFVGGAETLARAVAERLPADAIRLEQPVSAIRVQDDWIVAQTPAGSVAGRHLVLALPPALAMARIEFLPRLPEQLARLAATTPVWMGAVAKVVARYAEPFWRQRGLAGAAISHQGPMREIHDMSGPEGQPAALFGFAPAMAVGQPTVSEPAVLTQLTEIFGSEASHPVELLIHDWREGAYTSPPGVEHLTAYETFGHRAYATPALGGRLHWASTETATESPGHIEGALAAADRATRAILGAMS